MVLVRYANLKSANQEILRAITSPTPSCAHVLFPLIFFGKVDANLQVYKHQKTVKVKVTALDPLYR